VLAEELARLRGEGIRPDEFERALSMTRSSVLLALESTTNRMMRLARTFQMFGRVVTVDETMAAYERLTRGEASALVEQLLSASGFHCGAVGPLSDAEFARTVEIAGPVVTV
jgi:predicted Zn-dependent peptidase